MAYSEEIPPFGTDESRLLGWLIEATQDGDSWLQAQRPARDWDKIIETVDGSDPSDDLKGVSNTGYDLVTRNARDIVASLSSFAHDGEFKPRFDTALYQQANVLTQLDRNHYVETFGHEVKRSNIQNAVVYGTSYRYASWNKTYWGDHGDIQIDTYAPSDVTFVQLPRNHNIQQAYGVIIRDEMPLFLARRIYGNIAHRLVADRDKPGWLLRGLQKLQRIMGGSPALRVAGTNQRQQSGSFPTVDIFHMYVLDNAVNQTSAPMTMGAKGTNWTYTVPNLGSPVPVGIINPATGAEFTRPAEEDDCRLFPLRRYCVFSRTAVSYDGTSPWWHGQVPIARTRFNDWAWQALGKSLLSGPRTMQEGIVGLMRYIEDACAARLDPPILVDDQMGSEGFAKAFSLRKAGARAMVSLQQGDIMKTVVPVNHYDVPAVIPAWIKEQENRINHDMGTPDLVAIAKAKQVPGEATLEKLLEMAGPLVDDMFRAQEIPEHQLGEWRKALYFQFYTKGRIIQVTGVDDEEEDFEYTPDLLVPPRSGETLGAKQERTRLYLRQFKYRLTESSINERKRMVNKLALLQLKKAGVPIDRWTIYDAWNIKNAGPKPAGTHNVQERVIAELRMDHELAEEFGGQQQQNTRGRPATNQKPPTLVSKDHGTRSTVKTS